MHRNLDDTALTEYGTKLSTFARVALISIALVVAIAYAAPARAQQPFDFTVGSSSTSGGSALTPRITWAATGATSCTASTTPADTNWAGTKAATGDVTLPAITATRSYSLTCTWPGDTTATISWTAPLTNTDGSALAKCTSQTEVGTCLRSFTVVRGSSAGTVGVDSRAVNDRNATSYAWTGLTPGEHWFSVVAVNGNQLQSAQATPPRSKMITATSTQTRTHEIAVKFPSPPTNTAVQ